MQEVALVINPVATSQKIDLPYGFDKYEDIFGNAISCDVEIDAFYSSVIINPSSTSSGCGSTSSTHEVNSASFVLLIIYSSLLF